MTTEQKNELMTLWLNMIDGRDRNYQSWRSDPELLHRYDSLGIENRTWLTAFDDVLGSYARVRLTARFLCVRILEIFELGIKHTINNQDPQVVEAVNAIYAQPTGFEPELLSTFALLAQDARDFADRAVLIKFFEPKIGDRAVVRGEESLEMFTVADVKPGKYGDAIVTFCRPLWGFTVWSSRHIVKRLKSGETLKDWWPAPTEEKKS